MDTDLRCTAGAVTEWGFTATSTDAATAPDTELDVTVTSAAGQSWKVPAFWSGGAQWRVRFRPPAPGRYTWRTEATDKSDTGLHGVSGSLEASAAPATLPHGAASAPASFDPTITARADRFYSSDGRPFLWLGDTWWMGLCARWGWPEDFQLMCADRQRKGFNVVQIVAGLYPDMPAFDPRGANEAGFPWEKDWSRINPGWFNAADQRIRWMVRCGIHPCIVGAWGYHLPWLGLRKMKRHWREIVARWAVYPVFWALAGEATMPDDLSEHPEDDKKIQLAGWSEIGKYVKSIDPWHRPVSLHTAYGKDSRDEVEDPAVADFALVQCGNSGYFAQQETVRIMKASLGRAPAVPVVQAETCYEGAQGTNSPDMVRFCFWSTWLSGIAGYTYGADGIWQASGKGAPYGPSPTGMAWGDCDWDDAINAPGSSQVAWGSAFLRALRWEQMRPHQDWVSPAADEKSWFAPYAAGIAGQLRIVYYPVLTLYPWLWNKHLVTALEPGVRYHARLIDPRSGAETDLGDVNGDARGEWRVPCPPVSHDWLLVLEARA